MTNEMNPPAVVPQNTKRVYTAMEKWLLVAALVVAVLFNRLVFATLMASRAHLYNFTAVFWLGFFLVFVLFFWNRVRRDIVFWYVAASLVALCIWPFIFTVDATNIYYALITNGVIPGVLMAFILYATGDFTLKDPGEMVRAWFSGWFVKPLTGIFDFFGAVGSVVVGEGKAETKKAAIGILIALPLVGILLPLLGGADRAFGYHMAQVLGRWNWGSLLGHGIFITITCILLYSFFWNVGFGEKAEPLPKITARIDNVIVCIVLGSVLALYVLFCIVMFTYLFAGAGLPGGMTYYEYARAGFAQTVVVCAINLLLFGIFLNYGTPGKVKSALLVGLLALTGVMLFSGFVRLGLYIDAFGLTWLRILSAWFIIYLSAVMLICGVRIWKEKIPAIGVCGLLLLGWFVVLGYSLGNLLEIAV